MPNHMHMILQFSTGGRQVAAPTLSLVVGNMKRAVSMDIGFSLWQKSFHDHIIRDDGDYARIARYIDENPSKWEEDCYFPPQKRR